MIWRGILAPALAISIGSQSIAKDSSCADVYQNAVRNITVDTRDRSTQSFYFSLYCEKNGSTRSLDTSASVGFPIAGIPIEISGDGAWDQQELQEFCKIGAEANFYEASDFSFGSFVVTDALASYNQCLFIQQERLTLTHQEAPPAGFVVFGEFTSPTVLATIDAISYDTDELSCTSTSFSGDGGAEKIDGSRTYDPEQKNFSISCQRTKHLSGDREYYKRTWFQMVTSLGPYTVILPGDAHLGFNLASQAQTAYDAAIADRNNAIVERDLARSETQAVRQQLSNRIRTLQPTVIRAYQGDSHVHHANGQACPKSGGPNMSTWMSNQCPSGTRATGFINAGCVEGGTCGNCWYTISCLPNQ